MNNEPLLPEDDQDRLLARRIGERLAQQNTPDAAPPEDAFHHALLAYKDASAEATPPEVSERVWAGLHQHIAEETARKLTLLAMLRLALTARRAWMAVAASLVVLVGLGWLLMTRTPAPVLVASAETDLFEYTADDGSVVTLRPHSQLYALPADEGTMAFRLLGEGFFEVMPNEARTFSVEANDAQVSVLGTRFNVSTWGAQTMVYLEEGRVRFEHSASQQAVVLAPGERSLLTDAGELLAPEAEDEAEYLDWMRGEITFAQRPLRRILAELAHHYAITIDVPPALLNETLSGRILLGNREQSISDLAVVMAGRFDKINATTYRFAPE